MDTLKAFLVSTGLASSAPSFAQESGVNDTQENCADLVDVSGMAEYRAEFEKPFDAEATSREINELSKWIETHSKLQVEFLDYEHPSASGYLMCPFTGNDLMKLEYLRELKKHLEKYPPNLLEKIDIHTVRFAERIHDLKAGDQAAGFVMRDSGYLNLTIVWPFNHEVWHKIDFYLDGLNCPSEKIGIGDEECDRIAQENQAWGFLDPNHPRGLRRNWDEVQAEHARILFNLDNPELSERQYTPLLERRGSRKQLKDVKVWLHEVSDGAWDARFWKDLEKGKVNEFYWDERNGYKK